MASRPPQEDAEQRRLRVARAEAMQRARQRRWERRKERIATRLTRAFIVAVVGLVSLIGFGWFMGGIGIGMLLLMMLLGLAAIVAAFAAPVAGPRVDQMDSAPPAELPAITDAWLERQRRNLPRLAAPQVDAIAARLASLEVQLASIPANDPVAQDVGRLLGRHLPELVQRYTRVPPEQRVRTVEEDGRTLDATLVEGLKVVEAELARASDTLAAADRDAVRIQGKFLEARYGEGQ